MGTDVHACFQRKVINVETGASEWEYIDDHRYEGNRHYFLFGWLANVRNGRGFAGCDTGDAIKPLAKPRGIPEDFERLDGDYYAYDTPEYHLWRKRGDDLGDHSYSWLTSTEIIEGSKILGTVNKRGVMSMPEYLAWDKVSQPDGWYGGIYHKHSITIDSDKVTPQIIRGQKYIDNLTSEITRGHRKTKWVHRHVLKLAPENCRADYTSLLINWKPWVDPNQVMVERFVSVPTPIRKPSALKHLKKLQKYANRTTYVNVRVQWTLDDEAIHKEFAYFIDEIKRLHAEHGEIRMVFGFDS